MSADVAKAIRDYWAGMRGRAVKKTSPDVQTERVLEEGRMLPDNANAHLQRYWARCRSLFAEGDYSLAAFCAITLIEEVGKIPMLALSSLDGPLDAKALRRHDVKYASAVGMTLYVNSRVSRIYGEREKRFARWCRDGDLMRIRNSALYMDVHDELIVTPDQAVDRDTTVLLVCMAGEVLAEIQGLTTGTGPPEWGRILDEVDDFRSLYDVPVQQDGM